MTLMLRDQHRNLHVIPQAMLAASRVPANQLPALQQALDEVAGYLFTPMVQNDFLPVGGHAIGAPKPTFVGGLVGRSGPVPPIVQNEATPH